MMFQILFQPICRILPMIFILMYGVWYQIKEGYKQRNEFALAPEQQLGLGVLDFEDENISKFADTLNQSIKTKNYQTEYTKIFETLSLLQSEILNNIDKTTIL